jgi:citrate lyase subunit beta / citryl-CoA lyase
MFSACRARIEPPVTADLRRSALFVPAGVDRFYASAAASGADVIVLDLEDSVPQEGKARARGELRTARQAVRARRLAVRVNADAGLIADDIAACAACRADELLLPKVGAAEEIMAARRMIARHPGWRPAVSILVETLDALRQLPALLRQGGPLASAALGMEDLSAELLLSAPGRTSADDLRWVHGQFLLWTAESGCTPIGILGELANFADTGEFRRATRAAWRAGYRGTYCIHPAQVAIANASYAPDRDDLQWAENVLQTAAEADQQGRGSAAMAGAMVDAPIVRRARRIIDYDEAVQALAGQ